MSRGKQTKNRFSFRPVCGCVPVADTRSNHARNKQHVVHVTCMRIALSAGWLRAVGILRREADRLHVPQFDQG